MDLEQKPSWSKGDLRRLGEALVIEISRRRSTQRSRATHPGVLDPTLGGHG